jgi:hypothetical protein
MDTLDWKEIKEAKPQAVRETLYWVQGYILALEDVIKDLALYRARVVEGRGVTDAYQALFGFMGGVIETLESAQRTLDAINETLKEDIDDSE